MSAKSRHKDVKWTVGETPDISGASLTVLMDLRDEAKRSNDLLERLVNVLECHNTFAIPHTLTRIDRRLAAHLPLKGRAK